MLVFCCLANSPAERSICDKRQPYHANKFVQYAYVLIVKKVVF